VVEEHLYRIALEALNNTVKHAGAARADVSVTVYDDGLHLRVTDDGRGFDPERARPGHLGLGTMTERAQAVGAALEVRSAPGSGTDVTVHLPTTKADR
jgi:signal transduction histidine kinase